MVRILPSLTASCIFGSFVACCIISRVRRSDDRI